MGREVAFTKLYKSAWTVITVCILAKDFDTLDLSVFGVGTDIVLCSA